MEQEGRYWPYRFITNDKVNMELTHVYKQKHSIATYTILVETEPQQHKLERSTKAFPNLFIIRKYK